MESHPAFVAIRQDPGDVLARLACADALEEADLADLADAHRWMAGRGLYPATSDGLQFWSADQGCPLRYLPGWYGWFSPEFKPHGTYTLPSVVWYDLPRGSNVATALGSHGRYYPCLWDAEAALAASLKKNNWITP